ncbi:hypothetical protein ACEWY4_003893 [Coilia grayii]|uniref:Reverse transcriptase RNase H-like domain-containing protein n=1 Tax=Coilia grayii TaxID=363190 RepID=A0ABD1KK58_9TELE
MLSFSGRGLMGLITPFVYFSEKFLKHQLNYSTIKKEALTLLLALQHFEVYVCSSSAPVIVFTDHNPPIFLSRMKNTNQRIMRWSLYLQGFNLDLREYTKVKQAILMKYEIDPGSQEQPNRRPQGTQREPDRRP